MHVPTYDTLDSITILYVRGYDYLRELIGRHLTRKTRLDFDDGK